MRLVDHRLLALGLAEFDKFQVVGQGLLERPAFG